MAHTPPPRRDALITSVTIVQLQAELLQRQARRRAGLTETDRRWLETALATIMQATREMSALLVAEEEPAPTHWVGSIPTQRITVDTSPPHRGPPGRRRRGVA